MNPTTRKLLSLVVFFGLGYAAASYAGDAPSADGLTRVQSSRLDEFQVRPNVDLAKYRKVIVDPVQVSVHEEWLKDVNYRRATTRRIGEDEVRRVSDEAAASLRTSVVGAYRAKGYEVAAAPGSGVLRLSPRIYRLYVNALDAMASGTTKVITREAGEATLILEARDSVTGTLLARVVHRDRASGTGGFSRASDVFTRFWFDALFRRWAADCASEFQAALNRPSLARLQ